MAAPPNGWKSVTLAIATVLGFAMGLPGCVPGEVDLEGLACPCATGWSCVNGTCFRGAEDASAPQDLGSSTDLGTTGTLDGGIADQGPQDAAVDQGPGDAGVDATVDAAVPPTCSTAGALFCDDFESSLTHWTETFAGSGADLAIDDAQQHTGMSSMRATSSAPAGRAYATAAFPGVASGTIHARSWVYVPSSSEHATVTFMMLSEEDAGAFHLAALQLRSSNLARVYVGAPLDRDVAGSAPYPRDRWFCTSLEVDLEEATTRIRATVDGQPAADETFEQRLFGEVEFFDVGLQYTGALSPSAELFMDDVEVGIDPLPCDRP